MSRNRSSSFWSVCPGCADAQEQGWHGQAVGIFDVELVLEGQLCLQHAGMSHCFPKNCTQSPHPCADLPTRPSTALLTSHKSDPMPDKQTKMDFHPPASSSLGPTAKTPRGVSEGCPTGVTQFGAQNRSCLPKQGAKGMVTH